MGDWAGRHMDYRYLYRMTTKHTLPTHYNNKVLCWAVVFRLSLLPLPTGPDTDLEIILAFVTRQNWMKWIGLLFWEGQSRRKVPTPPVAQLQRHYVTSLWPRLVWKSSHCRWGLLSGSGCREFHGAMWGFHSILLVCDCLCIHLLCGEAATGRMREYRRTRLTLVSMLTSGYLDKQLRHFWQYINTASSHSVLLFLGHSRWFNPEIKNTTIHHWRWGRGTIVICQDQFGPVAIHRDFTLGQIPNPCLGGGVK